MYDTPLMYGCRDSFLRLLRELGLAFFARLLRILDKTDSSSSCVAAL